MKLFLWIVAIGCFFAALIYSFLILKRLLMIKKIKRTVKKQGGSVCMCRMCLTSVFLWDGKPDIIVTVREKVYRVSLFTTRFRRVRYHFAAPDRVEIYSKKSFAAMTGGANARYIHSVVSFDHLKRGVHLCLSQKTDTEQLVLLVYPMPFNMTRQEGTRTVPLCSGDILWGKFEVQNLSGFIKLLTDG